MKSLVALKKMPCIFMAYQRESEQGEQNPLRNPSDQAGAEP
jgi:hypothetical protein